MKNINVKTFFVIFMILNVFHQCKSIKIVIKNDHINFYSNFTQIKITEILLRIKKVRHKYIIFTIRQNFIP